jgi:nucleolar protein 15
MSSNLVAQSDRDHDSDHDSDQGSDQAGALLEGFDPESDDLAQDEGFNKNKPTSAIPHYKKTQRKLTQAAQKGNKDGPGTVYVGRIPHGFYENEMRQYFSQFGTITKLRLSRNRKTGHSKHFAFIEFESTHVAKIVAETMDNYLMFGHILKCKYVPPESLHAETFKGANKRFRVAPHNRIEKRALEAPRSESQWTKKNSKEQAKREKKAEMLKAMGYEMELPKLKNPTDVLQQRERQVVEGEKVLMSSTSVDQ